MKPEPRLPTPVIRLEDRRLVLALEARLLVELGAVPVVLGDLARLVQVALGRKSVGGRPVAEVLALIAKADTALGTVLKARSIASVGDALLLADGTRGTTVGVLAAAGEVGNVLGASGRRVRGHLVLAGVALLKVVELDASGARTELEALKGRLVELALRITLLEREGLAALSSSTNLTTLVSVVGIESVAELLGIAASNSALFAARAGTVRLGNVVCADGSGLGGGGSSLSGGSLHLGSGSSDDSGLSSSGGSSSGSSESIRRSLGGGGRRSISFALGITSVHVVEESILWANTVNTGSDAHIADLFREELAVVHARVISKGVALLIGSALGSTLIGTADSAGLNTLLAIARHALNVALLHRGTRDGGVTSSAGASGSGGSLSSCGVSSLGGRSDSGLSSSGSSSSGSRVRLDDNLGGSSASLSSGLGSGGRSSILVARVTIDKVVEVGTIGKGALFDIQFTHRGAVELAYTILERERLASCFRFKLDAEIGTLDSTVIGVGVASKILAK